TTGGAFRKHRSTKEVLADVDQEVLARVLMTLQDDLEARFEAAGWQGITVEELNGDVPQLKALKTNADLGLPMFKQDGGDYDQDYVVLALPGTPAVDPKGIGNGMARMRLLKGKQGTNFNVTYSFAAGTVGETNSRMLGTEAGAGLWFSARADLWSSKGGWGSIATKPEGMVVADSIGTIAEIEGSGVGTATNVIRFMGGMGGIDRTGYQMTTDWSAAETAMIEAGRAFNAEIVARYAH